MEGPGMSLFQGAETIHINSSAQERLEEQEELEDQKRRNEELKNELEVAFDDLLEDGEASSVNSSRNFTLDAQSNGINEHHSTRTGLPNYVESQNRFKELGVESPKLLCETPINHIPHLRHDAVNLPFSPYGAGDGQNNNYHQEMRGHMNGLNNFDKRQEYMNNEHLKLMLEMRVKECEQLSLQRKEMENNIESLRAQLSASITDREKAEFSLKEAHHLLASSKHQKMELEQRVNGLSMELRECNQEKDQLKMEIRSANISLQDLQQRLQTLQVSHTHDTDSQFRELQDRHREEVDRLHSDLVKTKNRLEEKENETRQLQKKCMDTEKEKDEIIIEKGSTINRLVSQLEAAQSRLVNGETNKLKEKTSQLTSERNTAREQVKQLASKLEQTAHELLMCRQKMVVNQTEYETWRSTLQQILNEAMPGGSYIGEPPSPGKLSNLKDMLSKYRQQIQKLSVLQEEISKRDKKIEHHRKQESELRSKLEEQKGTEMQLNSRIAVLQNKLDLLGSSSDSELLDKYKEQNEQLQADLDELRTEIKNLNLKYTELEMENEKLKSEKGSRASIVQETNADLLRELERYSGQLKETLKENGELKTLYLQACSARDAALREQKDVQNRIQKEKELFKSLEKDHIAKIEKETQLAERLSSELTSTKEELDRANKRISELQKEFTDKQKEFTDKLDKYLQDEKTALRKEREACTQCDVHLKHIRCLEEQISKFSVKMATQESNESLMKELKGKAEFFQQYIMDRFNKLKEQRSVATNTDEAECVDNKNVKIEASENCDDEIAAKTALMMKEKAIRDQIAEKFTLEIKTIEMNCARRVKEMESEHLTAVTKLKEFLERKAKEVETLKDFILNERAKVTKILEAKENEISVLIKEHNNLQLDCERAKDDVALWKSKAEKYKDRLSRLGSLEDALKSEREDWKQKSSTCAKEFNNMKVRLSELQGKVSQVEQKYERLQAEHSMLQDKYRNAKKTIFTYRDYMTKKDAHLNNEMNRIQDEYRKMFIKLQNQINYQVNLRIQDERSKGRQPTTQQLQDYDYTERMNKLHEELAKLQHTSLKDPPDFK